MKGITRQFGLEARNHLRVVFCAMISILATSCWSEEKVSNHDDKASERTIRLKQSLEQGKAPSLSELVQAMIDLQAQTTALKGKIESTQKQAQKITEDMKAARKLLNIELAVLSLALATGTILLLLRKRVKRALKTEAVKMQNRVAKIEDNERELKDEIETLRALMNRKPLFEESHANTPSKSVSQGQMPIVEEIPPKAIPLKPLLPRLGLGFSTDDLIKAYRSITNHESFVSFPELLSKLVEAGVFEDVVSARNKVLGMSQEYPAAIRVEEVRGKLDPQIAIIESKFPAHQNHEE